MKKKITSFKDLMVYENSYRDCIVIHKEILPDLPKHERYVLYDQLSRASKAIPRLIAEGYAKRHQRAGFSKYLDDAMGESNETLVCLEQVKDIYSIKSDLCSDLIKSYDITGRQIYKLSEAWRKFKNKSR